MLISIVLKRPDSRSQNVPTIPKRPKLQSQNGPTISKCPNYLKMSQLSDVGI